jgi:hypothetical protein
VGDEPKRNVVTRATRAGGSILARFLIRSLLWTVLIGLLSETVAEVTWPHIYKLYGPPLGMYEGAVFQAVLYGAGVASLAGGIAVGLIGTVLKR